jgi:hypothetical protein
MKFEDSPTMRALEKVAKERGLVKPETLQKKASIAKKADYTPTSDLMENIFKLCSGLRASGLEKEALEIETSYFNYKRAQTLYETSKEKGEDLVQSAHPKGSHKLEGVEGDEATIEDILDQHLKMMKSVEKKPTGKLSSSRAILNAVKVVLAQEVAPEETEEELSRQLIAQATKIIPMINSLISRLKEYGGNGFDKAKAEVFGNTITSNLAKTPIGREQLNIISDNWRKLITWARGAGKFGGDFGSKLVPWETDSERAGAQNWNANISGYANRVVAEINKLAPLVNKKATIQFMKDSGSYQGPGQPAMGEGEDDAKPRQGVVVVLNREAANIASIANNALSDLTRWQGWITMKRDSMKKADFDTAMAWLKSQYTKIDNIKKQFMEMSNDPERQNREAKEFTSMLNALIAENKEFREAWFQ